MSKLPDYKVVCQFGPKLELHQRGVLPISTLVVHLDDQLFSSTLAIIIFVEIWLFNVIWVAVAVFVFTLVVFYVIDFPTKYVYMF